MKKSEIVQAVDTASMAASLGLTQNSIKLALVGPSKKKQVSVPENATFDRLMTLFEHAKSAAQKEAYLTRAIDVCNSWDGFSRLERHAGGHRSVMHGHYARSLQVFARNLLDRASSFEEVHWVWIHLTEDFLANENALAFQRLRELAATTDLVQVFEILEGDGHNLYEPSTDHYDLILCACETARPDEADLTLKRSKDAGWNGEDSSEPIRVLIRKASELYPK